ncbi:MULTISPECIES: bacteriophage antitermination protein Q [Enterobacter]|uniref:bacteriophage antitermination protein Q n=1 Tax=Enterobacter TaxID=547 RepID=UPI000794EA57|nr:MULTISPECIES: bacteriophage antitermination protein Q [Enterobacter]MCU2759985.1 bacteriophage antitermination protein Q [Enterobacter hormaechei subsp. steigerwaltii]QLU74759.1 phage antitermination protein [Enterobacter cloacae]HDS4389480.1 phage antitermination protein [Enterobacter roggenkampii]HDT3487243.1 phage antitermination protein [Enterobacter hormaechei subsp. hoffmannii]ELC7456484.1 phage antitermination protein [Enterobacter hormaechei]
MELNSIRACVSTALSDIHYLQRGILEVQLEQLRLASSDRFTDKPTRTICIGDSESYELSVPAEPIRYHVGKSFKQSSMLLTELDFMTASWRRAIEQLNSEETAWLHYCYGCKPNYKNDVIICQWLWLDFLIAHSRSGFKKMKAPTKKIMQKLTYYGIQEVKSEILRDEQRDEQDRDEHISFLLGISVDSWRKDYKKRWLLMKSRCMHLNDTALLNAAEKRSEIIESHRARCANLPVSAGYVQETR